MSGSTTKGNGNTVTTLDPDLKAAWESVFGQAQDVSNGMLDAKLPQQQVAAQNVDTTRANNLLNSGLNAGNPDMNQAENLAFKAGHTNADDVNAQGVQAVKANAIGLGNAQDANAALIDKSKVGQVNADTANAALIDKSKVGQVDGGSIPGTNLKQYENPYQQQVVDATTADWMHGLQQQKQSDKADAIAANAFGGSREGVQQANTQDAADRTLATTLGNLNSQGYTQATGLAEQDLNRGLTADTTNQATNLAIQNANQGSKNAASQFNATAKNTVNQGNQNVNLAIQNANQGAKNNTSQFNATAQNAFDAQTAANKQNTSQFNAGQINDVKQGNQANSLAAQTANQGADLTANSQTLTAAQQLAAMGGQQQQMSLNNVNALNTQGATNQAQTQAGLNATYNNQQAAYQQPLQALQALESAFGSVIPTTANGGTSTTNSSGKGLGI